MKDLSLTKEELDRFYGKFDSRTKIKNGKKYILVPTKWRGYGGSWHYTTDWVCIDDK
jgi:hypothetical protein